MSLTATQIQASDGIQTYFIIPRPISQALRSHLACSLKSGQQIDYKNETLQISIYIFIA